MNKRIEKIGRLEQNTGFTLLEVMIAISVIAIVLITVYRLHAQTISMSNRSRFYTTAPLLAQRKLAEVTTLKSLSSDSGSFSEAFPGMTWEANLFVGYGEGRARSAMDRKAYPAGCLFESRRTGDGGYGDADWSAVGFVDYAAGTYRLAPGSAYRRRGTDAKDLGADMDAIDAATE